MNERIGVDNPAAAICPYAIDHWSFQRPSRWWRHASVPRLWVVEETRSFTLERHLGREPWRDEVTVALDPGTRLRYDLSDFDGGREFTEFVAYFFRVESGPHTGQCVRAVDGEMPWGTPDTEITPARLGLRPADSEPKDDGR